MFVSFSQAKKQALSLPRGARADFKNCHGCSTAILIANMVADAPDRLVVALVSDSVSAHRLEQDLKALAPDARVRYLPKTSESPYEQVRPEREVTLLRAAALSELHAPTRKLQVLIVCASAWTQKLPDPEGVLAQVSVVRERMDIDARKWSERLDRAGYQRTPLVEDPGSYAVRGDIIDVWPPSSPLPLRLEIEFDKLRAISSFDPETQRKRPDSCLSEALLGPAKEAACTVRTKEQIAQAIRAMCDQVLLPSSQTRALIEDVLSGRLFIGETAFLPALCRLVAIENHLPIDALVVVEDPNQVVAKAEEAVESLNQRYLSRSAKQPAFPPGAHGLLPDELETSVVRFSRVVLHGVAILGGSDSGFSGFAAAPEACADLGTSGHLQLCQHLSQARKQGGDLSALIEALHGWLEAGHAVTITARTNTQAERIGALLEHRNIPCVRGSFPASRLSQPKRQLTLAIAPLARGIVAEHENFVFLTEEEIFGERKHMRPTDKKSKVFDALDDLRHLNVGDYVVHVEHGIGKYQGLLHQSVGDITVDVLAIEYEKGDRLLLPVYRLNQIQKYSKEGAVKLDRLGGQTFAKTKSKVRKKVRDIADQLLKIYSARHERKRPPLPPPGDDYLTFEAGFPYEETPDQSAAISDVIADLTKDTVMDRLVCGDVGFGKTEVALRAAFLAAHSGRQVALLCPTTVLADQHLQTFSRRLEGTGLVVSGLSRFESRKNMERTLSGLKSGRVDVVIGTHRLLSKDVFFKDLGLLIIDEEQRFGVTHKERLKELKQQVDVLTLSATPIPRTLNLAVGGLFDMSVILTPPQARRAIRTQIARFDESIITDAITRELARGGQVFYVYNRVEGLIERAARLRELIPDLKVGVVHGQMSERELETKMHGFVQGQFGVLCATAIIESGLDIPRANTIIVDRADLFGLAQLYQLRGRVGRSTERAYCYLLVPTEEHLNPDARKRLEALERYSELGSGFQIATMDMEIRGAGDILGAEQTGFSSQVGFELFSEMLAQATAELSGEDYVPEVDPELSLDVEALLPESYISDIGVRLSLYKRYASATSAERIIALDEEVSDRFGAPPPPAQMFSLMMLLKTELRQLRALGLQATRKTAHLHLRADTPLSPERLVALVAQKKGIFSLSPDGRLTRRATDQESFRSGLDHAEQLLSDLRQISGSLRAN